MKNLKVMVIVGIMGMAVMLMPKASLAADVSVGFFWGLPVPVVALDPPRIHHVPPPVVVAPAPVYHARHAYGPVFWHQKDFRHGNNWKHDHEDFAHKYDGRGRGDDRHDNNRDGR